MGYSLDYYRPNPLKGDIAVAFFHTHPHEGNYFHGLDEGDAIWGRRYGLMMIVRSHDGFDHENY